MADIYNTIMDKLVEILALELQELVPLGDPLRVKTIQKGDLYDDPDSYYPLVLVMQDPVKGSILLSADIGGTIAERHFFYVYGEMQAFTRANAESYQGVYAERIKQAILKHWTLDGVSNESYRVTATTVPLDRVRQKLEGGPDEWVPTVRIDVHFDTETT